MYGASAIIILTLNPKIIKEVKYEPSREKTNNMVSEQV